MKKILSLCIGLISLSTFAQTPAPTYPDSLKAKESKEVDYAMQIVTKLCDPTMKGRSYAKNGDKIAAEYIMNEFKANGVDPFGGSYFQKYFVTANTFPERMTFDINGQSYAPGVDFLVDGACPTIIGTFKPVYITRKEINDRMVLMDKLRDAKETLMLIDNTNREGETPEMGKKIDALIEKMKTDQQVQLKGVVIYNRGRVNWGLSSNQAIRPTLYIAKETDLSSVKEIKVAIDAELKQNYETQNVIGIIEGSVKKDSFIVIAAHYDHLGTMGNNTSYPGANNSASGIAMLLSLAKHYSIVTPKYSVLLLALSGTELGFAGAQAFANNSPVKPEQIKFLINFDMMGNGAEGIKVINGTKFENEMKTMQKISKEYKLLPKVESAPTRRISNHCIFDEKGIPSIFVYSLGGTINYKNLNDTPQTLPFTKFENTQKLIIRFLETIK